MDGTGKNDRAQDGKARLKTTTWGALISLSLLAGLWGYSNRLSTPPEPANAPQSYAQQSPQEPAPQANTTEASPGLSSHVSPFLFGKRHAKTRVAALPYSSAASAAHAQS